MSKTTLILESLFTGADEDECTRRDKIAPKILQDEWMEEFLARPDVKKLPDGSYDVDGHVDLDELGLTKLPVKFNGVSGPFSCVGNKLTNLIGAPKMVGGGFSCYYNELTSLEGAPKWVGSFFWCDRTKRKFTEEEIRAVSDVQGHVYV